VAYRSSGVFKVAATNTPQPMFGSWITAVSPTGSLAGPTSAPIVLTLGTAQNSGNDAAQIFVPNEDVWLIDPNGANAEQCHVQSISANTLTLGQKHATNLSGLQPVTENAHAVGAIGTGTFIMPKQMVNNFLIDLEDGGSGTFFYLGNRYNMTNVLWRIYKLAKTTSGVQPQFYNPTMYSPGNPFDISELFIYGTQNDLWNVTLIVD
jgi:hypothetical protein